MHKPTAEEFARTVNEVTAGLDLLEIFRPKGAPNPWRRAFLVMAHKLVQYARDLESVQRARTSTIQ